MVSQMPESLQMVCVKPKTECDRVWEPVQRVTLVEGPMVQHRFEYLCNTFHAWTYPPTNINAIHIYNRNSYMYVMPSLKFICSKQNDFNIWPLNGALTLSTFMCYIQYIHLHMTMQICTSTHCAINIPRPSIRAYYFIMLLCLLFKCRNPLCRHHTFHTDQHSSRQLRYCWSIVPCRSKWVSKILVVECFHGDTPSTNQTRLAEKSSINGGFNARIIYEQGFSIATVDYRTQLQSWFIWSWTIMYIYIYIYIYIPKKKQLR